MAKWKERLAISEGKTREIVEQGAQLTRRGEQLKTELERRKAAAAEKKGGKMKQQRL